jgi:O-antigen/teichoic acid export membrane protein
MIKTRWYDIIRTNLHLLSNASSLVGAMAINSALGFAYWWLAARFFSETSVGVASASVSAMTLLANVSMLGFGTLLLGELPRRPGRAAGLIGSALLVAGTVGLVLGMVFALCAPAISPELGILAQSGDNVGLFGVGVGLAAVTLVLDQALVGLSRGGLQLRRNVVFASVELVALAAVSIWWRSAPVLAIYGTWVVGFIISLFSLGHILGLRRWLRAFPRMEWRLLRSLGLAAIGHHALNLVLQTPGLVLPLVVTAILGAKMNAGFYMAWMVASLVFVAPDSLAVVLFNANAANQQKLASQMRVMLALSAAIGVAANLAMWLLAGPLLTLFGAGYEVARDSLRLLTVAVFPLIVRDYFVALRRISGRVASTAGLLALGGALEISLAAVGAQHWGLNGLTTGWLSALCVEALCVAPVVVRAARRGAGQPLAPAGDSR